MGEKEYDVKGAAKVLKVSAFTVRRMLHAGEIGHYRRGRGRGRIIIRQSDIEKRIAARTFNVSAA